MKTVAILTVLFLSFNFIWVFHTVWICPIYCCCRTTCLNKLNCHFLTTFHHTRALQARRHFPFLFMKMTTIPLSGTWPEIFTIFTVVSYYFIFSWEKIYLLVHKKLSLQFMSWSSENRQVWLCFKCSFTLTKFCSFLKPAADRKPQDVCLLLHIYMKNMLFQTDISVLFFLVALGIQQKAKKALMFPLSVWLKHNKIQY